MDKALEAAGKAGLVPPAGADVDLRGARAWPDDLIMEVLVARLASLAKAAR